jgi:methylated-DNA-[protein]-cysteine S-methyltransferase
MNTLSVQEKLGTPQTGTSRYTVVSCPFGDLLVVTDDGAALTRLWLPPASPDPSWERADDLPILAEARSQLRAYFAGERTDFDLPLAPRGTAFQRKVWEALRRIDYGTTKTYGQIALEIGAPGGARAVGAANHDNPIAIVQPCHRVIGANGKLVGFAGGLDQKRRLLDLEAAEAPLPL